MSDFKNAAEIQLSEQYDKDADIYYVTVLTGEPSIVEEADDRLLIEIGMFSGMPTGFRILGFSKQKAEATAFKHIFKELCKRAGLQRRDEVKVRQQKIEQFLEKVEA
jgi:uncharacterized protein YuzE